MQFYTETTLSVVQFAASALMNRFYNHTDKMFFKVKFYFMNLPNYRLVCPEQPGDELG